MNLPSKRLAAVASLVRRGSVFADVGTDHAYIPAFLVSNGICGRGYAGDLRKGPLSIAEENLAAYGVRESVETFLCDGLTGFPVDKIDDIIIAGMGGDTVINIIEAENRIKSSHRLILQPMTNVPKVRSYLYDSGFDVADELLCEEDGKIYNILLAKKQGVGKPSFCDVWFGKHIDESPLREKYRTLLLSKHKKHLEGLLKSKAPDKKDIELERKIVKMLEDEI